MCVRVYKYVYIYIYIYIYVSVYKKTYIYTHTMTLIGTSPIRGLSQKWVRTPVTDLLMGSSSE